MAKDYTKYQVNGIEKSFNKSRLVQTIVKDYISKNNPNLEEEDGYKFTLKNGKWKIEEWYGEHPIFEHQNTKEGVIDSLPSKLKEVYKHYLNVLNEGEMDIVDCGWSNYRMSEKSLIDYMERRIRGEKVKFPDDYFPF